jgi:hypothetical protein
MPDDAFPTYPSRHATWESILSSYDRDDPACLDEMQRQGADLSALTKAGVPLGHAIAMRGWRDTWHAWHAIIGAPASAWHGVDQDGWTLGLAIAQGGSIALFTDWLHNGGDIHRTSRHRHLTAGLVAAKNGHVDIVRSWWDAGGDGLAGDRTGITIGHHAAKRGHHEILDLWMGRGGDPYARTISEPLTSIMDSAYDMLNVMCAITWLQQGGNPYRESQRVTDWLLGIAMSRYYGNPSEDRSTHAPTIILCAAITTWARDGRWDETTDLAVCRAAATPHGSALIDAVISVIEDPILMAILIQRQACDHRD